MSKPDLFWDTASDQPTPTYYLALARTINDAARHTIRLDATDGDEVGIRVSIGLSLQAAELAGNSILRSCGHDAAAIKKAHGRHGLLELLVDAESIALDRARAAGLAPQRFLSVALVIDGVAFRQTIRAQHTSCSASASVTGSRTTRGGAPGGRSRSSGARPGRGTPSD